MISGLVDTDFLNMARWQKWHGVRLFETYPVLFEVSDPDCDPADGLALYPRLEKPLVITGTTRRVGRRLHSLLLVISI